MSTDPIPTYLIESPNRHAERAQKFLAFASPIRNLIDRGWVVEDDAAWTWEIDADLHERLSSGERELWRILELVGVLSQNLTHLDPQSRRAVDGALRLLFADTPSVVDELDDLDVPLVPVADGETFVGGAA